MWYELTTFSSNMQIGRLKRIRNCVGLPLLKHGKICIASIRSVLMDAGATSCMHRAPPPARPSFPVHFKDWSQSFLYCSACARLTSSIEMNGILYMHLSIACASQHMWNSGLRRVSLRAVAFPYLSAVH